ncbi:hypothetical protein M501DRAFT_1017979 [Patellaria atrata CBS 101060]|uniref:DUF3835 domain-containing protein n=1 Tax=Patellaria atrata CBS 101060 TaxID=1346257 RepID=A0A9P4S9N0_9PEZI|nr:hypothetical protein M501DRAFT_1017979 [Patellaria atrata CBS 101060]
MANSLLNPLEQLEQHRLRLERNLEELGNSLRQWQTWEAEYEGLKEEIKAVKGDPTPQDLLNIGMNFGGDVVNEKEIKEIGGLDKGTRRSRQNIIDIIQRRIDYSQQNAHTLQKQMAIAQDKLANLTSIKDAPELKNEEGLAIMEIEEELDDEDNVISSSMHQPEKSAANIIEAAEKALGAKIMETEKINPEPDNPTNPPEDPTKVTEQVSFTKTKDHVDSTKTIENVDSTKNTELADSTKATELVDSSPIMEVVQAPSIVISPADSMTPKKMVSFAEDTKEPQELEEPKEKQRPLTIAEQKARGPVPVTKGERIIEVNEFDEEIGSQPIIPIDEDPIDAEMRREMLSYGLNEVGAVVAELDLEEGDMEYSDDDDYDEDSYDSDADYEDEFGRSTRREIDDDYRKEMMELEKKLNATRIENVGPQPGDKDLPEELVNDISKPVDTEDNVINAATKPATSLKLPKNEPTKKGVRFAEELDISPALIPAIPQKSAPKMEGTQPVMRPVSDRVLERPAVAPSPKLEPVTTRRISRFKSARTPSQPSTFMSENTDPSSNPEPRRIPEGPVGEILAKSVIEKPVSTQHVAPPDPDAYNPELHYQEVAVEYHNQRNARIHQQGGFKPSLEEEEDPLFEEKNGQIKKVSRFRAARLKKEGLI